MKTKIITGMDEVDLTKKQWDWQITAERPVRIVRVWPDEMLPIEVSPRVFGAKLPPAKDQFQRRLDYED